MPPPKQPLFPGAAPPVPAAKRRRSNATSPAALAIVATSVGAGAEAEVTETSAAIEELQAKAAALLAKEMKEKEKKDAGTLRQKQRRALGLRYDWLLLAVKWLVCSFPETGALVLVTQGELDSTFRTYGVRYDAHTQLQLVNALGNALSSSTSAAARAAAGECNVAPSTLVDAIPPAKVIWRCEPCSAYVKHTANHSSHQLT